MQTVLIAGSDGYIGTLLCRRLSSRMNVIGIDAGFVRDSYLYAPTWDLPKTLHRDIRQIGSEDLAGVSSVVCLADLTDPTSQAMPAVTRSINHRGVAKFATACKAAGVRRFVYSSSASVYGRTDAAPVSENAATQPRTPYAEFKLLIENHLLSLADETFSVTSLRNATVFGLSPRLRFDLLVNHICGTAVADRSIHLNTDGTAWRPFVHIDDVVEVFASVLASDPDVTNGLILNVGNGQTGNCRVIYVARQLSEITGLDVETSSDTDPRSYRLDTTRLSALGITCGRTIVEEMEQMVDFLSHLGIQRSDVVDRRYNRLAQLQHLRRTGRLNGDLRWL